MHPREKVFRTSDIQRCRRHLLRLAVLTIAILPFVSAIAKEESPVSLKLVSSAFEEGGAIPKKYTCEGQDISPPLAWSGVPQSAKSLVLIVDDPDAPDPKAPKMTWVHWVLYNLPAFPRASRSRLCRRVRWSALMTGNAPPMAVLARRLAVIAIFISLTPLMLL